jgi:hypothetical protein
MVCRTKSGRQNASQGEKNFPLGLVVCILGRIARDTPIYFQSQSDSFGIFVPIIENTRLLALALQGVECLRMAFTVQPERFGTQGQFQLEEDASENE